MAKQATAAQKAARARFAAAAKSAGGKIKKGMRLGGRSRSTKGPTSSTKRTRTGGRRMARKKGGGRRRPKLINGLANLLLLILAFFRPLSLALGLAAPSIGGSATRSIIYEATAGAAEGRFDKDAAFRFYGPVIGSLVLFEVKKQVMRKFGRALPS